MTWQSLKFSDISQGVIAVPLWIPSGTDMCAALVASDAPTWWQVICFSSPACCTTDCRSPKVPGIGSKACTCPAKSSRLAM